MKRTKAMIEEAFSELLEEKMFSKITVRDIVERCGVNRNTFYYHFQDIPALCEQILKDEIDDLIANHGRTGSLQDCVCIIARYFKEHKSALLHIYRSLPREYFLDSLDRLSCYLVEEYIDNVSEGLPMTEAGRKFLVRYYKCVLVGWFLDWMDSNMSYDLEKVALEICDLREEDEWKMIRKVCWREE